MDRAIFRGQEQHHLALLSLLAGVAFLADGAVLAGDFLGTSTLWWLLLAIAVLVLHQWYVWLIWRLELYHSAVSRRWGKERGFALHAIGFTILFVSR